MRKQIQIGELNFKTKKEAITFYKQILNSYEFGESINPKDFDEVYELLKNHHKSKEKIGSGISEIRVENVAYNTKGFLLVRTDLTTDFFSYRRCIDGKDTPLVKFSKTCRKLVEEDIRKVKESYCNNFIDGQIKCQETGELCKWEGLVVDHRQPNTFSVIVDRFIEINNIDIKSVKYRDLKGYGYKFVDDLLTEKFREYHKTKANLRVVKKEINQKRSNQGKNTRQKKDLTIK